MRGHEPYYFLYHILYFLVKDNPYMITRKFWQINATYDKKKLNQLSSKRG
jgi:hypothetical protein